MLVARAFHDLVQLPYKQDVISSSLVLPICLTSRMSSVRVWYCPFALQAGCHQFESGTAHFIESRYYGGFFLVLPILLKAAIMAAFCDFTHNFAATASLWVLVIFWFH